jgi:hypothetical protein
LPGLVIYERPEVLRTYLIAVDANDGDTTSDGLLYRDVGGGGAFISSIWLTMTIFLLTCIKATGYTVPENGSRFRG